MFLILWSAVRFSAAQTGRSCAWWCGRRGRSQSAVVDLNTRYRWTFKTRNSGTDEEEGGLTYSKMYGQSKLINFIPVAHYYGKWCRCMDMNDTGWCSTTGNAIRCNAGTDLSTSACSSWPLPAGSQRSWKGSSSSSSSSTTEFCSPLSSDGSTTIDGRRSFSRAAPFICSDSSGKICRYGLKVLINGILLWLSEELHHHVFSRKQHRLSNMLKSAPILFFQILNFM